MGGAQPALSGPRPAPPAGGCGRRRSGPGSGWGPGPGSGSGWAAIAVGSGRRSGARASCRSRVEPTTTRPTVGTQHAPPSTGTPDPRTIRTAVPCPWRSPPRSASGHLRPLPNPTGDHDGCAGDVPAAAQRSSDGAARSPSAQPARALRRPACAAPAVLCCASRLVPSTQRRCGGAALVPGRSAGVVAQRAGGLRGTGADCAACSALREPVALRAVHRPDRAGTARRRSVITGSVPQRPRPAGPAPERRSRVARTPEPPMPAVRPTAAGAAPGCGRRARCRSSGGSARCGSGRSGRTAAAGRRAPPARGRRPRRPPASGR